MNRNFALWEYLFIQYLKRDWKKIVFWIVGLGLFCGGFIPFFEEIAKGDGLLGMYETMQNPAMISIVGPTPISDPQAYTIGAMYSNEMLLFCGLFAFIISAMHVVGHTRREEDLGLQELIRSFRVGREANALAVMVETVLINLVLALFVCGLMVSFNLTGIDVTGSLLFGLSIAMLGIVGAVVGLLMAQVMSTSAGAIGGSIALLIVLYIVRATTDISNVSLSMMNPLGWGYLTYPFVENNWLPIVYALVFSIVGIFVAFVLESKRDMQDGYIPQFEGKAHASKRMLSVPGMFWRITRGTNIAWLIGFAVMGAAYGSVYADMQSFLNSNEMMQQMFTVQGISIEVSFTATIMFVVQGLAIILPIVMLNKLYNEERRGHLSQVYSTKVSRNQIYWSVIGIAICLSVFANLAGSFGLGGMAIASMSKSTMTFIDFIGAGFNYFAVFLFFIGLGGLCIGYAPKLGKLLYLYLGYSFMVSYFLNLLDLPEWVNQTSALNWMNRVPMESFNVSAFLIVGAIGIVMMILGAIGYHRRDLHEGV
ncbi:MULTISPECIES: tetronasin resistance protein [Breznakia]|uniref:ABC-2 type transport system permease protein n=1 Tax=Breznakia blatticola TaxID=1754012 RepID=A0A4R8A5Y6_9FIRM|nr:MULTISPECIES: tetronasin resistance protein [Breznakia]MDH6366933.1 ABC-2 type transport system permease protein [Breznakia sp. PH1-1]MDH6404111.1 ABC-2 type transport system permease protein [Breznakia sp. PF1-11]MDH6411820.1 ABC-2 type transport system permease protein [Breznakia sp. PFB1-11]MDH6414099.1 ABC-2 type transport system permease protein [Breznakia sp. PFB1-14]MDH6416544.1 ABC-2 type transport system permease protein [Breznakia sp. PFB1-4]